MKLLVDAHVFDRKFQGVRTYLEGLYVQMTKFKDIDFFFAANNDDYLKSIFGEKENIHYIHLSENGQLKRLIFEFPQIIKKYEIEYAHFQYISPFVKRCKYIVTVHDLLFIDYPQFFPWIYRIKFKFLFKHSAKKADFLLTVSEFSKNELNRLCGIDKSRIYITHNGVLPVVGNVEIEDVKKKYNIDKYILLVSRVEPRKNHLILLKAFNQLELADKGYKLVFVGGEDINYNSFFNYYKQLQPRIKDSILFLQVPFEELIALYKGASLFVFPSICEGFGIPPIEAIAYGCPLLCSIATAMSEFNLPEEISFDPENIEELKSKMKRQLESPLPPSRYRDDVLSRYNWKKIAEDYHQELVDRGIIIH